MNQVGGQPANFLDIGGRRQRGGDVRCAQVINNDPTVRSIIITSSAASRRAGGGERHRHRPRARADRLADRDPARRHQRRRGPGDSKPICPTRCRCRRRCSEAAQEAVDSRGRPEPNGDICRREHEGRLQGTDRVARPVLRLLNRSYGTQVVAGTNRRSRTDIDGIPVFASVAEAGKETGATVSCIFIPAPGVRDAVLEAAEGASSSSCASRRGSGAGRGVVLQQAQARLPDVQLLGRTVPASSAPASATSASPPATSRSSRNPASRRSAS